MDILFWQESPTFKPSSIGRMDVGNYIEEQIKIELRSLGYKIVEDSMTLEYRNGAGKLLLRGKTDGGILLGKDDVKPFEIKTMDRHVFNAINSIEDFDRFYWTGKYVNQLESYLLIKNIESGFFILSDCMGSLKFIELTIDYARAEQTLRNCEEAVRAVEDYRALQDSDQADAVLPAYHSDKAICLKCPWYNKRCFPFQWDSAGPGMILLNDAELKYKLDLREETREARDLYEKLDKDVKEFAKASLKHGDVGLIEGYMLTRKDGKMHKKACEAHDIPTATIKIEKL